MVPFIKGQQNETENYSCQRILHPIKIDGDLSKPVWQNAIKSPRFVDMASGDPGELDTRAAALWDDEYLYIGFWVEEPFVQAQLTERDQLIFNENDIEVFIDGGDCYYEFEINDNSMRDKGWTVELAFPWKGMKWLANGRSLPPKDGDVWSIFFGRFQKYNAAGKEVNPHPAWVWNPHGVYDTHLPERFTKVEFKERR